MNTRILLTATVRPNVRAGVLVSDPEKRISEYRHAISEWSKIVDFTKTELHILETSGVEADALLRDLDPDSRSKVHFTSTDGDAFEVAKGKGAVEFSAIAWLGNNSSIFDSGTLYKATGRLVVRNARSLVQELPPLSVAVRRVLDRSFVDTRFFGASCDVWQGLAEFLSQNADDRSNYYAEHALGSYLGYPRDGRQISVQRFAQRPRIDGVSGSNGERYIANMSGIKDIMMSPIEAVMVKMAHKKQV